MNTFNELKRMRCATHGQTPTLKQTFNGISVTSCCDAFSKKVVEKYGELLRKEATNTLHKPLKKSGR